MSDVQSPYGCILNAFHGEIVSRPTGPFGSSLAAQLRVLQTLNETDAARVSGGDSGVPRNVLARTFQRHHFSLFWPIA